MGAQNIAKGVGERTDDIVVYFGDQAGSNLRALRPWSHGGKEEKICAQALSRPRTLYGRVKKSYIGIYDHMN